jgi:hypothetical protein
MRSFPPASVRSNRLTLRAGQFVAQDAVGRRGLFGAIGHTPVMPELKNLYKYGTLDRLSETRQGSVNE